MKNAKVLFISLVILNGFFLTSKSQFTIGSTEVDTNTVATNLDTPWEILWGPDDHIWFTERYGKISTLDPETGEKTELVTIGDINESGEGGLLGMVLHPDFVDNPYVYVVYNYLEVVRKERLVRYTYSNGSLTTPVTLLEDIVAAGNHNGSRLVIDDDYKLYMTTGDAGNTALSQDLNSLNGKVLRLNLDGSVPEDNPFAGSYIWSWGHRNAQGLVISPGGIMYSSEHGPSNDDELNIIEEGRNYGWPNVEGFCDDDMENLFCADSNVFEPIAAWTPTLAVAGIDFYDQNAIPEWKNSVLVTTLKASRLVVLNLSQDGRSVIQEEAFFQQWYGRLRDICIAPDGRVFLAVSNKDGRGSVRQGDDKIVEIVSLNTDPYCYSEKVDTLCLGETYNFYGLEINQPGTYIDTISNGSGCDTIVSIQIAYFDAESIGVEDSVMIAANDTVVLTANESFVSYAWNGNLPSQNNSITIFANELGEGTYFYSIEVESVNGCIVSDTVVLMVTPVGGNNHFSEHGFSVFPNPVREFEVKVNYSISSEAVLVVYNQVGMEVSRKTLSPLNSHILVAIPEKKGIYYLTLNSSEGKAFAKVVKL